jgi:phage-related protein
MQDMANAIDTSAIPEKVDNIATKSKNKWNTLFDLDNITKQKLKNAVKEIDSSTLPNVAENIAKKSSNKFNGALDWINIAKNKLKDTANAIDSNSGVVVTATQGMTNQVYAAAQVDTTWIGQNVVYGLAEGIDEASMGYRLSSSLGNLANRLVNKLSNLFGIHSPSTVMRDEIGYFLPLGIAEGIDDGAYAVENSIQDLVNKTRVDMQAFDFYTGADLVSSVNGSISAKTSAALSENSLNSMANATYEGMLRALTENNEDYNPQFNVYVGNDKVYSGYANYQNNESNRYGVKV